MSHDEDFQKWIEQVMSKIIESFGSNIDQARYEITEPTDVIMSTMYYACVKFKNRLTGQNEEHSIILKRPLQAEVWRQMTGSDFQFHNEILFYRMYGQPDENFPRCFYVDEKPPADSVIALENVNKRGYCPCPHKYNVPLEYTLAAMREIGRFHGKGYVMKELQKENFFDIVGQLQDCRFDKTMSSTNEFKLLVNSQATRAVEYLRSHDHDTIFCDKMEALLSNAFDEVMMKTVKPLEPLSTLCHGDFTSNNILFKTEDDGQQRAMLIDFALLGYSTPVVDLSTYLCLCCSNEVKKNKFSEIMRAYHDALKEYLLEAGVWDVEKYSYEALTDDYRRVLLELRSTQEASLALNGHTQRTSIPNELYIARIKMSHDKDFQKWIEKVMSKIIESFGSNIDQARYEVTEPTDVYMSTMYYACVKFKNKLTGQNEEHSVILKRPLQTEVWRQMTGSEFQFHNEILFYRMYGQPDENFPRCFYVDEKPPADSVIALENVNKRGYCPCPHKFNVPLEYTLAAMREIGRFHGKGYVMKELQKENFFDIVGQLQECRFDKTTNEFKLLINSQATRAVEYLRSHDHDTIFCDKMEALLSNAFDEVMMKTIKPLEPLSTLCHGDFTSDNILFKTEDDGQQRAMLIDFALLRYSTPVVDLSTYLCLCCSNEVRKDKFFEIMRVYHDALKEYLLEAGISDIEKYSYDALLDDYKRGGLFGLIIASFFLPKLMGYCSGDRQQVIDLGAMEVFKLLKQEGGDEVSKILADMLLHLRDLGCLKYFL